MNYNDVLMHHYISDDFLCHHGILGQKWGIRRFQNPDGTLTPAGRKRYLNDDGSLTRAGKKEYDKIQKQYAKEILNEPNGKKLDEKIADLVKNNKEIQKLAKDFDGDGYEFIQAVKDSSAISEKERREIADLEESAFAANDRFEAALNDRIAKLFGKDKKSQDEKILKDAGITVETYGSNNQFTSYSIKSKTADGEFEFETDKREGESTNDFVERMKTTSKAVSENNDTVKSYGKMLYDEDAGWWDEKSRGKRPSKEEFVKGLKLGNAMQTSDGKTYLLTYEDTVDLYGGHYVTFEVDDKFKYHHHTIEG